MSLTIRHAAREDCPRIMELIEELAEFEKAPPGTITATLSHLEDSGFGPHPVWWAFVAEENGHVIGFALYYIRYSTWRGQRLYLEDLIVTHEKRGLGAGRLLFDRLIQETEEKGFSGMTWQVLDWNEPTIQFYKKYGADIEAGWHNCNLTVPRL
ncbi:GNAT family N-acetyltransferase [Dinghuibacter silviterrae]|uniref:L-amino acid N-acyltransferase YncA n=1 Tax=Dinghuibacter silviterrae TaxID=1539049 RepID=A0A4V3GKH6_9BACT|nr:GNAT family N-acetyltransferase [Dinghuibacter silviterrae]TDW95702.1 L-amino acid N-acyltransferase YncA [Dinghuibacter silviterrae]